MGMTTQHTCMLHQLSPATTSILYMNTASTHGMVSHMHTYTTVHPSYSSTHIIMYTYSINTCMTVYECTHTQHTRSDVLPILSITDCGHPHGQSGSSGPSSLQGTQHHTHTVLGPLVSHCHHTDMYTGRRSSLTTSHHTLQTPPYHYRVDLHALHSVPT